MWDVHCIHQTAGKEEVRLLHDVPAETGKDSAGDHSRALHQILLILLLGLQVCNYSCSGTSRNSFLMQGAMKQACLEACNMNGRGMCNRGCSMCHDDGHVLVKMMGRHC